MAIVDSWLVPAEVLENTPSRQVGFSVDQEKMARRRTAIFLEQMAKAFKIDWQTQTTATVFFHYFFVVNSFQDHNRLVVATACMFLAAKVDECRQHRVWRNAQALTCYLHEKTSKKGPVEPAWLESEEFKNLQDKVLTMERLLLRTIAFDLVVTSPQSVLLGKWAFIQESKEYPPELFARFAKWTFDLMPFCMRTTLCLSFTPECLASAALWISAIYHNLPTDGSLRVPPRTHSSGPGLVPHQVDVDAMSETWKRVVEGLTLSDLMVVTRATVEVLIVDQPLALGEMEDFKQRLVKLGLIDAAMLLPPEPAQKHRSRQPLPPTSVSLPVASTTSQPSMRTAVVVSRSSPSPSLPAATPSPTVRFEDGDGMGGDGGTLSDSSASGVFSSSAVSYASEGALSEAAVSDGSDGEGSSIGGAIQKRVLNEKQANEVEALGRSPKRMKVHVYEELTA